MKHDKQLAIALGNVIVSIDTEKKFKKMAELFGERVVYKKGREWFFNTTYLKTLSVKELESIAELVK